MRSAAVHIILIAVLGLLAYRNTFNAPFVFDDRRIIVENPAIRDLDYFVSPSKAGALMKYPGFRNRVVGFLTFSLNHRLHGLDVRGYHAANILIHIINAVLVYLIAILAFRSPRMKDSALAGRAAHIALLSALLFVAHPIQTQAVTYITQRFTSLAATFYLLSLALYATWRLTNGQRDTGREKQRGRSPIPPLLLYGLSLLFAVLSMKTKEIAVTLPLAVALYEAVFFRGGFRGRLLRLASFLLTIAIIPYSVLGHDGPADGPAPAPYSAATSGDITRMDYLLTEFRVMVTYMRLLVLPVNQNLDYDFPVFHSLSEPAVLCSFLFISGIFGLGLYFLCRARTAEPALRFVAFGIFLFFLALSVESGIVPLKLINEHRLYLPSAGAFWAFGTGAVLLAETIRGNTMRNAAVWILFLAPVVLLGAAHERNAVWKTERGIWEDVVRKSPRNPRAHSNLGDAYRNNGLLDSAIGQYRKATELKPDYVLAHNNLGNAYMEKGMPREAMEHYRAALRLDPDYAEAHSGLGDAYKEMGFHDEAIRHYETALDRNPSLVLTYNNLGVVFWSKGLLDRAEEQYNTALRLNPNLALAYNNLGVVYGSRGLYDRAIEYHKTALGLDPDYADAHYNLGLLYFKTGDIDRAHMELETVLRINPGDSDAKQYIDRINNMRSR